MTTSEKAKAKAGERVRQTRLRLFIYFIVYAIAQGAADAYEEAIETPFLYEVAGLNFELVGLAQTIDFIPLCFKFVFAIPSDSYDFFGFGHRRPYVVIGLTIAAIAFGCVGLFTPTEDKLWLYMLCMIIRNCGIALADCAVDGLSVDADMDAESGALQGWMSLGRTAGTVMAAVSAGHLAATSSYHVAIFISACFVFLPLPANFFIKEEWTDEKAYGDVLTATEAKLGMLTDKTCCAPTVTASSACLSPAPATAATPAAASGAGTGAGGGVDEDPTGQPSSADPAAAGAAAAGAVAAAPRKTLKRRQSFVARVATAVGFDWALLEELLGRRHVWLYLLFVTFGTLGIAVTNFAITAWAHEERGFAIDEVGILMSAMSIGCFAFSLPIGYAFDYIPSKKATMMVSIVLCGLSCLVLVFCHTKPQVYAGIAFFGAAHGAIFVVQNSTARVLADMRIAAAFFGLTASVGNAMHALGTAMGGPIAERISLEACFIVGAVICFIGVVPVLFVPDAAMRLSQADPTALKVLPHRKNWQPTDRFVRKTALNTEGALLRRYSGVEPSDSNAIQRQKSLARRPSVAVLKDQAVVTMPPAILRVALASNSSSGGGSSGSSQDGGGTITFVSPLRALQAVKSAQAMGIGGRLDASSTSTSTSSGSGSGSLNDDGDEDMVDEEGVHPLGAADLAQASGSGGSSGGYTTPRKGHAANSTSTSTSSSSSSAMDHAAGATEMTSMSMAQFLAAVPAYVPFKRSTGMPPGVPLPASSASASASASAAAAAAAAAAASPGVVARLKVAVSAMMEEPSVAPRPAGRGHGGVTVADVAASPAGTRRKSFAGTAVGSAGAGTPAADGVGIYRRNSVNAARLKELLAEDGDGDGDGDGGDELGSAIDSALASTALPPSPWAAAAAAPPAPAPVSSGYAGSSGVADWSATIATPSRLLGAIIDSRAAAPATAVTAAKAALAAHPILAAQASTAAAATAPSAAASEGDAAAAQALAASRRARTVALAAGRPASSTSSSTVTQQR